MERVRSTDDTVHCPDCGARLALDEITWRVRRALGESVWGEALCMVCDHPFVVLREPAQQPDARAATG